MRGRHVGHSGPFGLDAEGLSPGAQVAAALAVIVPVMLSGLFFAYLGVWWVVTTYGWVAFPAFGLLVRGVAGLGEARASAQGSFKDRETELLRARERHGELTPARAAVETSIPVSEVDRMLRGLAEAGHLEVRVRGGSLFYALWESEGTDTGVAPIPALPIGERAK